MILPILPVFFGVFQVLLEIPVLFAVELLVLQELMMVSPLSLSLAVV
jgi:hypothetical protein